MGKHEESASAECFAFLTLTSRMLLNKLSAGAILEVSVSGKNPERTGRRESAMNARDAIMAEFMRQYAKKDVQRITVKGLFHGQYQNSCIPHR